MGNSFDAAGKFSPCVVRMDSLRKGTELLLGKMLVMQDPQTQVEQGNTYPFTLHCDIHLHQ